MPKMPSMDSNKLVKLLETGGAFFVRQGATDHAIYARLVGDKRYSAPVQMGQKSLDPVYCKRVMRQLQFSDQEIEQILTS
jgi:predicted RNA binding protein YcfA (HicA-like mRNA interferase family)